MSLDWPRDDPNCELGYISKNSYESKHPDDPLKKYRHHDGSFVWWWHTWRFMNSTAYSARYPLVSVELCPPLPWVFDQLPEIEFIKAAQGVGYLNKLPGHWDACGDWFSSPVVNGPVYHILMRQPGSQARKLFIHRLRQTVVSDIDLIALCDQRFLLY